MTILPPDANLEALRWELGRLRAARGWSYDDLAERTGLGRRTLIEIEQGRTVGSLSTWHAIAHAFGTPLGGFLAALCEGHEAPAEATEEP